MIPFADVVRSLLADLLAGTSEESGDIRRIAKRIDALPVWLDMGGVFAIRPDGTVVSVGWDGDDVHIESHPRIVRIALVSGAEKYPELEPFVPARPTDAVACDACGGTGEVFVEGHHMPNIVCACGGLGWVLPDERAATTPLQRTAYEVATQVCARLEPGDPCWWMLGSDGVVVAAVSDGWGSWGRGTEASRIVPRLVVERLRNAPVSYASFDAAFQDAAKTACGTLASPDDLFPPDASIAAVHLSDGACMVAWAGACCAVQMRQGTVVTRTRPWRLVDDLNAAGQMSPGQAPPPGFDEILTTALKVRNAGESAEGSFHHLSIEVQPGDAIILGTQGLLGLFDALPPTALRGLEPASTLARTLIEQLAAVSPKQEHAIVAIRAVR